MISELEPLIGTWRTRGHIRSGGHGPDIAIEGRDTYHWVVTETVMLHRVDVRIGGQTVQSCEIIGPGTTPGEYFMHAYDPTGAAGEMAATIDGATWRIHGPNLRFTGTLDDKRGRFAGIWERLETDGRWTPWMNITLLREVGGDQEGHPC